MSIARRFTSRFTRGWSWGEIGTSAFLAPLLLALGLMSLSPPRSPLGYVLGISLVFLAGVHAALAAVGLALRHLYGVGGPDPHPDVSPTAH